MKPGADPEEIKAAYRKAAMELHPDRNDSENAHQYFVILQNAYQYLIDHPYSEQEVEMIITDAANRKRRRERQQEQKNYYRPANRTTLQEILKQSPVARRLYVFFHFFFILIGVLLLFSSVYDIFFHPLHDDTQYISAYSALISGLLFGIAFTSIFSVSIINYFRNR